MRNLQTYGMVVKLFLDDAIANSSVHDYNLAANGGHVSRLRRIALNLLKQEKTAKCGIKIKQHKAGWDEKYLQKILEI